MASSPALDMGGSRRDRNKKKLTLGANTAKPGTLSGQSATSILAVNSSSPSTVTSPPGSLPVASSSRSSSSGGVDSNGKRLSVATDGSSTDSARSSSPSIAHYYQHSAGHTPSLSSSSFASSSNSASNRSSYHNRLSEQLATLELGVEFNIDLRAEDLKPLEELGSGNGGTVTRCVHVPTKAIMAKKVVHIASSDSTRKQIVRELQIMHDCSSPYIVTFYGAFLQDPHVCMCMEYMDKGSLDSIYRKVGPIPEPVLGKIAYAVVHGLTYLYETHKIMHRDVKPSNVLLNSNGRVKICDFGVSGELINSVADTFVGTSTYMSPERISGDPYTVKSDVWSLGITLVELAIGRFPFSAEEDDDDDGDFGTDSPNATLHNHGNSRRTPSQRDQDDTLSPARPGEQTDSIAKAERRRDEKSRRAPAKGATGVSLSGSGHHMSILELLQYIVNEPAPRLPAGRFSNATNEFIDAMLRKEPVGYDAKKSGPLPKDVARPTPKELLEYRWMKDIEDANVDMVTFARSIP